MGCGPSKNSLSRVADSTCEYNRCYMKECDKARRKQKKTARQNRRHNPTYNNFSSTSKVYDRASGTSKITVRLSTDGSMLEIEQFDVEYDSTGTADVAASVDDDQGLVMKSVSELKALHKHGNLYGRCDSAPLLISGSSMSAGKTSKQSGCALTSCCIQNWSNSRTISDEYKPKSTSNEHCRQDNEVGVEHACEVHRNYEPNTKTSDGKSLDSDSLNSNSCKNMDGLTDASIANEPVIERSEDFQKATIHVKRSTLEQQVKDAYKHGMESHLYDSCSTFKPFAKTETKNHNGAHFACKGSHDNGSNACLQYQSQNKHTTVVAIGESSRKSQYTNSKSLGMTDLDLNQTEASLVDNYESRLDNRITENNQSCLICSACEYDKNSSESCQCTRIPDVCRAFETTTQINNAKQYQPQVCSCCDELTDRSMYCCCCFTRYTSHQETGQQCMPCSQPSITNTPVNNTNDEKPVLSKWDETMKGVEMLESEQDPIIDRHNCIDCGKKLLHSLTCTHRTDRHVHHDTNTDPTSFTTSFNDGNVFQTNCGYSTQHVRNHIKHVNDVPDLLQIRRCNELTTQRPCVPNKTIGQNLDVYNNSHCAQKSIDKTERLHHEQFTINKRVRCVHNEKERFNVDNLEAVVMVTNEVRRPILKDDGQPCNDSQYTERSDKNEYCHYCDDMPDIVDKDVYHDTCNCRKRLCVIASKEYQLADYRCDIDEQPEDNHASFDDPEKRCSEMFNFSEYDSFIVRDSRRGDLNETHSEKVSSAITPLIGHHIEESSSSDEDSDDVDFDDGSSDECRDEYVDALETTYV